jgi:HK97 family phage prohead protease
MHDIETRNESDNDLYLEGYFAVFNEIYKVWEGATESIAPGAFDDSLHGDVRALYNHNDDVILGRTAAGTLELKEDNHGLWGRIKLNRNDTEAMNVYERIKRGDITGCSFGFNIAEEETEYREDGTVHWTIKKVDPLFEISPTIFPAYEATSVSARGEQLDAMKKRKLELRKQEILKRIRGENDGNQSTDAEEEN